jgi:hypothetical protein
MSEWRRRPATGWALVSAGTTSQYPPNAFWGADKVDLEAVLIGGVLPRARGDGASSTSDIGSTTSAAALHCAAHMRST